MNETQQKIADKCDALKTMLIAKNAAYGNSATEPVEAFARGLSPEQRMGVRMDDKISRLQRGHEYAGDDTLWDLAGYLVLLLVLRDGRTEVVADADDKAHPEYRQHCFRRDCPVRMEHEWFQDSSLRYRLCPGLPF